MLRICYGIAVVLVCNLAVSSQSAEQLAVDEVLDVPVFNANHPLAARGEKGSQP
jgi:hypothetical protein